MMSHPSNPAVVVVVGSVNTDYYLMVDRLPLPGETVVATGNRSSTGGKGANQAISAAENGAPVEFIGAVGRDDRGRCITRALRDAGVGVRGIATIGDAATGRAWVTVDSDGENSIVVLSGANHCLSGADAVRALHDIARASANEDLLILCQGEIPPSVIDAVSAAATEGGWRFVLNLAPFVDVQHATLASAHPLIVNETEASQLLSHLAAAHGTPLASRLSEVIGAPVIVTLGSRGAQWHDGDRYGIESAAPVDQVVDTTGAGDAFVGAVAARLAHGDDIPASVRAGVRSGARAVQRLGA